MYSRPAQKETPLPTLTMVAFWGCCLFPVGTLLQRTCRACAGPASTGPASGLSWETPTGRRAQHRGLGSKQPVQHFVPGASFSSTSRTCPPAPSSPLKARPGF